MADVSVVIPSYKCSDMIARAVRSAIEQPGVVTEVIVVVDEPCEATRLAATAAGADLVLVNHSNRGAPFSRNRGLGHCSAPATMFLDADDYLVGEMLQDLLRARREVDADIVLGPWRWLNPDTGSRRNVPDFSGPAELVTGLLEQRAFAPPSATLWRTGFISAIGGWDEGLDRFTDLAVTARALLLGARMAQSTQGEGVYFDHASPHRMTCSSGSVGSAMRIADSLLSIDTDVLPREELCAAVARFLYSNAMIRLRNREYGGFRELIRRSRALGYRGRRHRVAGSMALARIDGLLGTSWHRQFRSRDQIEQLSPASSPPRPERAAASGP